ncbi:hypothetical protein CPPEL_06035 [Corynebacterium pseudopelargi]|uniref:Uncharacterized protein n=1 Tax=Corynebacterium pseudopelargi TaxID=2080757 RepID=A0A3G6IU93_9CORY|nr:hypothetical protein CPPEL_06035 [Corynebacterium pseudopelargi]
MTYRNGATVEQQRMYNRRYGQQQRMLRQWVDHVCQGTGLSRAELISEDNATKAIEAIGGGR